MTTFATRAEWGARPPRSVVADSSYVGVCAHWEGPHMGNTSHSQCAGKVRAIQRYHMDSRGWSDIAYNFVACSHDFVFDGRGWDVRNSANGTTALNSAWLAVCYLGGEDDPFTDDGKRAMRWVFDQAAARGHTERTTHRRIRPEPTVCPGDEIDAWVMAGLPIDLEDDMPLAADERQWLADVWDAVTRAGGIRAQVSEIHWGLLDSGVGARVMVAEALRLLRDSPTVGAPQVIAAQIAAALDDELAAAVAAELAQRLTA